MLARVDEVVCLQEIEHTVLDDRLKGFSLDGGQVDWSVSTRFREKTFLGDGADVRGPKVKGTSAVVKNLLKIWQRCRTTRSTPSATALRP